jgi:hypothetical protein
MSTFWAVEAARSSNHSHGIELAPASSEAKGAKMRSVVGGGNSPPEREFSLTGILGFQRGRLHQNSGSGWGKILLDGRASHAHTFLFE